MKNASLVFICCILFMITLPVYINFCKISPKKNKQPDAYTIRVANTKENTILNMPLEEYVWRVTAKEIPLSYHDEAIKSQLVVARTYALKKQSAISHDNGADVCTDHTHCTAFLLPEEDKSFIKNNNKLTQKLITLTQATHNQIITYENQPILAAFHAISSGTTEKSSDIWQAQLPYLINVDSSVDKNVNGYYTEKKFKEDELRKNLEINPPLNIDDIKYTDAGSVKTIVINGKSFTGTEIRNLLNLRSSNFSIKIENGIYTFCVKGYGHGVGMSQTGANELAKRGLTYEEILLKYYPGCEIKNVDTILNPTK